VNDPIEPSTQPTPTTAEPAAKPGFAFTTDGCRTDVRLGALLILMAVFLWLWLGPSWSSKLYLVGAPLLLWGVPMQALQARREGRPGYPWRLGLALGIGGALMWPDLTYRERYDAPLQVQPVAPLLAFAGAWILAWWPVARRRPAVVTA
jgi:uncharacterized membrane protein HdeD (DUF308 family)